MGVVPIYPNIDLTKELFTTSSLPHLSILTPTFMSQKNNQLREFVDSEYFKNPARITTSQNCYLVNQAFRNAQRSNLPLGFNED